MHFQYLLVRHGLSPGQHHAVLVVKHRAGERLQTTFADGALQAQHLGLHPLGQARAKCFDLDHAFAHTAPGLRALPSAVDDCGRALAVIVAPMMRDG